MKYDEKMLRKKLKRRILYMVILLLPLLVVTALTWNEAWVIQYAWPVNPEGSYNINRLYFGTARGGVWVRYVEMRNYTIGPGEFTQNKGYIWRTDPCNQYPYINNHTYYAGFQIFHDNRNVIKIGYIYNETNWVYLFPIWIFAIVPVLVILLTLKSIKNAGRKLSAFPVIMQHDIPNKGDIK
jgi:hypothetical protein